MNCKNVSPSSIGNYYTPRSDSMDDSSSNYDYDSGYLSNSDVDMSDNEEMRGFDFFPLDLQPKNSRRSPRSNSSSNNSPFSSSFAYEVTLTRQYNNYQFEQQNNNELNDILETIEEIDLSKEALDFDGDEYYGYASYQNHRPYQEDRVLCEPYLYCSWNQYLKSGEVSNEFSTRQKQWISFSTSILEPFTGLFAVFDGHGGSYCSQYCKDHFLDTCFQILKSHTHDAQIKYFPLFMSLFNM